MRSFFGFGGSVVLAGAILAFLAGPLPAQVVPGETPAAAAASGSPTHEAAAIHSYLCMQQRVAALRAQMEAKVGALHEVRRHLVTLDARLRHERSRVEVNNPQSVARYKALLERRDALAQHSWEPAVRAAREATFRYNAAVHTYNARYADRQFDAATLAQIRAHLSCGPAAH